MFDLEKDGQRYSIGQFRERHPNVRFPGETPPKALYEVLGYTRVAIPQVISRDDVNAERDRRLPLDFEFDGKMYQRDPKSIARISGAGTLALAAISAGAQPGDLFWHGRATPFAWIASDDTLTTMDAQTCFAFGQAAAAVETEIIFAAKTLREMDPIPPDYTDDSYWPPFPPSS